MKNIFIALSFLFIISSCRQFKPPVPQFVFSGKITNLNDSIIKLVHPLDEIVFKINEDGTFSDTISDFVDGFYKLKAGKEYTDIYIEDGFNLYFDLDIVDFDESIKYKGLGADENNYLAQKLLFTENVDFWGFYKLSEDSFIHKIDSFKAVAHEFLGRFIDASPHMSKTFINHQKADLKYFAPSSKENYQKYHRFLSKNDEFTVSDKFYDYRKKVELENIFLKEVDNYTSYAESFFENQIAEDDTLERAFSMLRIINREIKDNKLKKFFIYRSAKSEMKNTKKLDEYWALVSFMVTEKRDFKELKKIKRKLDKIKVGSVSPLTNFKDENDKEYSLKDFRGKIVYIDCWAQWCAPCKKEIPFLSKLEEKYADKDITFIKLSLDADVDAWKTYIKEKNLEENAFILENNFKSEFAKSYMINGIPRFILLDKNLKIIDSNAKRPSDEELVLQFDKLLD